MKILKNLSIYTLTNVFSKGLLLLNMLIITNSYTTSEYGILSLSNTYISFFSVFFTWGLNAGIQRFYFELEEFKRKVVFGYLLKKIIGINIVGALLIFIVYLTTNYFNQFNVFLILIICSLSFVRALEIIQLSILQIKQETKKYSIFSIGISVIDLLCIYIFVFKLKFTIEKRMLILLINTVLINMILYRNLKGEFIYNIEKKDYENELKRIYYYCSPLLILPVASLLLNSSDRIVISKILDIGQLGIYSFVASIISILGIISNSYSISFYPIFLKNYEREDIIKSINSLFFSFFSLVLMIFVVSCDLYIPYFFKNKEYIKGLKLLPYFGISSLVFVLYSFYSVVLTYKCYTKKLLIITSFSGVLNIIINFILAPNFKLNGVIFSNIITIIIQTLIMIKFVLAISYNPINIKIIFYTILIFIIFLIAFIAKKEAIVLMTIIFSIVYNFLIMKKYLKIIKKIE